MSKIIRETEDLMPEEIKQAQSKADLDLLSKDKLAELRAEIKDDFENDAVIFDRLSEYYFYLSDREYELADQGVDLSQEPHKEDEFIEERRE